MAVSITWIVEVAFTSVQVGVFRIGTSTIGGTDVIGGLFIGEDWTDVTSDVKSLDIKRGRDSDLGTMQAGRCVMRLNDSTGKYNPENSASPFAGDLRPLRPVRVRATHPDLTQHDVFYGFISSIQHDARKDIQETTFDCIDLFEWLFATRPTIASMGGTTAQLAIEAVLDAAEWRNVGARDIDKGRSLSDFSCDGQSTALKCIQDVVEVDHGVFFIAKDGKATFRANHTMFASQAVSATWTGASILAIGQSSSLDSIVNRQKVTKAGGAAQTANDVDSQAQYAIREGSNITSDLIIDDAQSLNLAEWIVLRHKDPESPARDVAFTNRTQSDLTQQLTREIGDLVRINESASGTDMNGIIQRIEHAVTDGGTRLDTVFTVSKKTQSMFTIDVSAIGGADVIGY